MNSIDKQVAAFNQVLMVLEAKRNKQSDLLAELDTEPGFDGTVFMEAIDRLQAAIDVVFCAMPKRADYEAEGESNV